VENYLPARLLFLLVIMELTHKLGASERALFLYHQTMCLPLLQVIQYNAKHLLHLLKIFLQSL
jgi:hypothetical protein